MDPRTPVDDTALAREWASGRSDLQRLRAELGRAFLGGEDLVEQLTVALLAGGHVLIEGAPGLGKTTLARALAEALGLEFRRVQFTPDLMPGDILGVRVLVEDERGQRTFEFQPGPVFCHVLLADEINRASPRTQSALLEAMQERQVTVHGVTRPLEQPFMVVATQNPIEMEGTYPLPEAQLDRFLLELQVGSPTAEELEVILRSSLAGPQPALCRLEPVLTRERVQALRAMTAQVAVSSAVLGWIARTVAATHPSDPLAPEPIRRYVRLGASPRGAQSLLWAARARAFLRGRLHVADEDVTALAEPTLRHRISLTFEGQASGPPPDELVRAALLAARERA
jgi:MoxR-like ATPase